MDNILINDLDRQYLIRLKNNLIDSDLAVDDARRDVDLAVERLREAVGRRDDIARQLAALISRAA